VKAVTPSQANMKRYVSIINCNREKWGETTYNLLEKKNFCFYSAKLNIEGF
jgi:hypothetical protein